MAEPIFDPAYWSGRLSNAITNERIWSAVFDLQASEWGRMRRRHQTKLMSIVGAEHSIIDIGCGWGRLLGMIEEWWKGHYLGLDISPEMISLAQRQYPAREFVVHDIRQPYRRPPYDFAVCIGIKQMVIGNAGLHVWSEMLFNIRMLVKRNIICLDEESDTIL